jgi:hypothetical protein
MHIRFALTQTNRRQGAGLVSVTRYADKEVVKFNRHRLVCEHGGRFPIIHNSNLKTGAGASVAEAMPAMAMLYTSFTSTSTTMASAALEPGPTGVMAMNTAATQASRSRR